jgi:hypothetical protein
VRCRLVWLVLWAALATGCADETARLGDRLRSGAGPARIALMPMDVVLSRVSAGGVQQPMAAWTLAAEQNLGWALQQTARDRGLVLHLVPPDQVGGAGHRQTLLLQDAVQQAILLHHFGDRRDRLPNKHGALHWSLGAGVRALRQPLRADYALHIRLRDSYSSDGRRVLSVLSTILVGVPLSGGQQIGIATLVDLWTGQVVWARALDRGTGDLRDADSALETAQALLKDLPQ